MEKKEFKAYVVEEKDGAFTGTVKSKSMEELPEGDLLVNVRYSTLNYKDALSASGNKGVTKKYPHTPGIDAAGIVVKSDNPSFKAGDKVIAEGYDLGMNTDGGFEEFIRIPSQWAVKLPEGMSMKESMIYGTAGYTAGSSVLRLSEFIKPEDGMIAVSGATGGVGSISVAILSKLGYEVAAITGKEAERDFLLSLGAKEIILRRDFENMENRPLLKGQFAGAVDTVGGTILENIIKSAKPNGVVTCCGNAASVKLDLTVFPFILRGITLMGIDSQSNLISYREKVWNLLASEWKPSQLAETCSEITLEDLQENIDLILKGKLKGRTIIKIS